MVGWIGGFKKAGLGVFHFHYRHHKHQMQAMLEKSYICGRIETIILGKFLGHGVYGENPLHYSGN